MKKLLLICSILVLIGGSSIGTYLVLDSMGAVSISEKKELTFSLNDETKEYDGKPLFPSEYIMEGELAEGHKIGNVTYVGEITEVGKTEANMYVSILDSKNRDVTDAYEIEYKTCELEVLPRPVTVTLKGAELEYNGLELQGENCVVTSGALVEGHKLIPSITGSRVDIGVVDEEVIPRIYNQLGLEVTSNYDITYIQEGNIVIVPRKIEIYPTKLSKVYDGEEFKVGDNYKIVVGSLVEGHTIDINFSRNDMVNAGTYYVTLECVIKDRTGEPVTDNYEYNVSELFEVEITKKVLNISLPNLTKTYDGYSFEKELDNFVTITNNQLPDDLKISYGTTLRSIVNVEDSCLVDGSSFPIKDVNNEDPKNYEINYTTGSLSINKKDVYVYSPKLEKIYDDKPFDDDYIDSQTVVIGLAGVDDDWTQVLSREEVDYKDATTITSNGVSSYGAIPYSLDIVDRVGNYEVHVQPSTVEIKPIIVTISIDDKSIEYNQDETDLINLLGSALSIDANVEPEIVLKADKNPDSLKGYVKGTYQISVETVSIDGKEVSNDEASGNYKIVERYSNSGGYSLLVVASKVVDVPVAETETIFTYDGIQHESPYALVVDIDSTVYSVKNETNLSPKTNAGEYKVTLELIDSENYAWSDGAGKTRNLVWTINKAQLERPISAKDEVVHFGTFIELIDTIFTYNGENQTYNAYGFDSDTMEYVIGVKGGKEYSTTEKDAGNYNVGVELLYPDNYEWIDGTADIVEFNWTINKIRVTKPEVDKVEQIVDGETIKVAKVFEYNKNPQTYNAFGFDGETMKYSSERTKIDAGDYKIKIDLKDKTNYCWDDQENSTSQIVFDWTINKIKVTKPVKPTIETIVDGEITRVNKVFTFNNEDQYYIPDNFDDLLLKYTLGEVDDKFYVNNAKNAGQYNVRIELIDDKNYEWEDGTKNPVSFQWLINPKKVTKPSTPKEEVYQDGELVKVLKIFTYNNEYQYYVPENFDEDYMEYREGNIADKTYVNQAKDAGTYNVRIELLYNSTYVTNCVWDDDSTDPITFEWKINKISLTKPVAPKDDLDPEQNKVFTYIKDVEQTYETENFLDDGTMEYVNETISLVKYQNKATDAGLYKVGIKLTDDKNYEWEDGTNTMVVLDWEIEPIKVDKPVSTVLNDTVTYTGLELDSPYGSFVEGWKIKKIVYNGTTHTEQAYLASLRKTYAGKYTATISLEDNYVWSDTLDNSDVIVSWMIKKDITISLPDITNAYYLDDLKNRINNDVNDQFTSQYNNSIDEVGNATLTISNHPSTSAIGTFEYTVNIVPSVDYLNINIESGSLTVKKEPITVSTSGDIEKIYDGEAIIINPNLVRVTVDNDSNKQLGASDKFVGFYVSSSYQNDNTIIWEDETLKISSIIINDPNGANVTENFEITYNSVNYTVSKRSLFISLLSTTLTKNQILNVEEDINTNLPIYVISGVVGLAQNDIVKKSEFGYEIKDNDGNDISDFREEVDSLSSGTYYYTIYNLEPGNISNTTYNETVTSYYNITSASATITVIVP